jgi:hypothetical protein
MTAFEQFIFVFVPICCLGIVVFTFLIVRRGIRLYRHQKMLCRDARRTT